MGVAPLLLRHGPLAVYAQPLPRPPDLAAVAQSLPAGAPVLWLDSARTHEATGRWSLLGCEPWLTLSARGNRVTLRTSQATQVLRAHPLAALRQTLRRYAIAPRPHAHARALGLMGFLSYELNRWIERLPPPREDGPAVPELLWFGMGIVILVDHVEQRAWLVSVVDPHEAGPLARRRARQALERAFASLDASGATPVSAAWSVPRLQETTSRSEFERMVEQALEHILAGNIFQANVSQRFTAPWQGQPLALYRALRAINPSPFACFLRWEDLAVVSCSPERLVRCQDGRVDTRPIAGTRPRGGSPEADALNSLELLLSDKERAEHIMLVDLERNDLGRVCEGGSVRVDELMTIEAYSHVLHIVSSVCGRLRARTDAVDVIRAVFPGGTITGCPKVRCMELLRELEPVPRGLYTGSLGYVGFDGTMDLNIAIRTMVIQGSRLSFHAGAGIVADSIPGREYEETLAKAAALMEALGQASGASHARA
ncbi:MAG: anthranilate synthase component I family protein [Candidatus Omnitrophica bacterium]|nr:anthranilate synthase component I family protein [Candidatus Omnitrophota bacterium]